MPYLAQIKIDPRVVAQVLGKQSEPFGGGPAVGTELGVRSHVVAIENGPMFAEASRSWGIDETR